MYFFKYMLTFLAEVDGCQLSAKLVCSACVQIRNICGVGPFAINPSTYIHYFDMVVNNFRE
jgi:hypothetical protein